MDMGYWDYDNKKLIDSFLEQLKDEVEDPEKYLDCEGDIPSDVLWWEIERRGIQTLVPKYEIKSFLIIKN